MKKRFAAIAAIFGVAALVVAYRVTNTTTAGFLSGLAGNLLSLALGILIVNLYLENKSKRSAVLALLSVTQHHVAAFHNHWISTCWAHFGKDRFGQIAKEYLGSGGKPIALSEATRKEIYHLYNGDQTMQKYLLNLDESLTELSRLAGWSLNPDILEASLKTRLSISQLREISLNDSPDAYTQVTEHLLDTDISCGIVLKSLMDVAGVQFKDIAA
ncbi:hypothetical protein [Xanthomonas sacchari]|uniref:hypothetical protein n=1 Tax=Xanthomonas sacchari TaxID=56458 RepID=UPI0020C4D3E0|nr:hypothetical protein [Xanthomonas sacchari]